MENANQKNMKSLYDDSVSKQRSVTRITELSTTGNVMEKVTEMPQDKIKVDGEINKVAKKVTEIDERPTAVVRKVTAGYMNVTKGTKNVTELAEKTPKKAPETVMIEHKEALRYDLTII